MACRLAVEQFVGCLIPLAEMDRANEPDKLGELGPAKIEGHAHKYKLSWPAQLVIAGKAMPHVIQGVGDIRVE